MTDSVAVVVVTYNRRELLRRVMHALFDSVPSPDRLIVVDNASTDGSAAMARAVDGPVPVEVVALPANTGGAGGFHAGIAAALDAGADWVWLMDDDGRPDAACLARLLPHGVGLDFFGPVVVSESGFFAGADVRRVAEAGAHAVLVGEGLVRATDVAAKLRELKLL